MQIVPAAKKQGCAAEAHQHGRPVLPIRWVLVRNPCGRFDPQALLATELALGAAAIVGYFVRRWQVEVTFEETRRHLGIVRRISEAVPIRHVNGQGRADARGDH